MQASAFSKAKWIWIHNENRADEYAEFLFNFDAQTNESYIFRVTGDSNFVVYLNGEVVGFGQPTDYPHYKIYDTFTLSPTRACANEVRVLVWYYGIDTQAYIKDDAGVIFELEKDGEILYASSEETLGRLCVQYENYRAKNLTVQLGLGYKYLAYEIQPLPYRPTVVREKGRNFAPRATERVVLKARVPIEIVKLSDGWLIDMREETVGFLDVEFESDQDATVTIAYGEYLKNGAVNRFLNGEADFSVDIAVKKGKTVYTNYFRRLAGRYLQIITDAQLTVKYVGLRPTDYPLTALPIRFQSELRNQIYQTSVKTLLCCMHEHYEDCPWREQALYNIDSRNEMLCTYAAFGDYRFARANLVLMTKGLRKDGLLSICFPAGRDIPIPSFSMIYPVQVYEYVRYSGDKTILAETFETIETIMGVFMRRIDEKKKLIANFPYPYWNFYEWSEGSANEDQIDRKKEDFYPEKFDLLLNVEFLYVLGYYKELCAMVRKPYSFDEETLKQAIIDTFYVPEKGLFKAQDIEKEFFTTLGNSYALLCGLGGKELAERLVAGTNLVPITLSMNIYLYDALLSVDKGYKTFILNDIDRKYQSMLEQGATTFWETEKGSADQAHTGSLCHGWAAMPIYYYRLLNGKEYFSGTL